jgi:hypothetical protein
MQLLSVAKMHQYLAGSSGLTYFDAALVVLLSEPCGLPPFLFFSDSFYREISSF